MFFGLEAVGVGGRVLGEALFGLLILLDSCCRALHTSRPLPRVASAAGGMFSVGGQKVGLAFGGEPQACSPAPQLVVAYSLPYKPPDRLRLIGNLLHNTHSLQQPELKARATPPITCHGGPPLF